MKTHNPPTFDELLKQCESGPFTAHKGQDDDDAHLVDQDGATVALFIPCGDEDRSAFIHAQTCARLLNFAHAGGFATIQHALDRINCANARAEKAGLITFYAEDIEASIAILNGQTK